MRAALTRIRNGIALAAVLAAGGGTAVADWKESQKAFREGVKSPDWKIRKQAYLGIQDQDGAPAVEEILNGLAREDNSAVVLAGIRTLSFFMSGPATTAMSNAIRKEKGNRRAYVLLAMGDSKIDGGKEALLEVVKGTDPQAIALAALALGKKQIADAVPRLVELLRHKDWQVRSASARGLMGLKAYLKREHQQGIAAALEAADGRERGDLVELLQAITAQKFGWDVGAWKALAAGDPAGNIRTNPRYPPYVAGIPIYGKRVAVVLDHSICTEDAHPFGDRARLQELCKVPGARDVAWFSIKSVGDFYVAHARRLLNDLPDGTPFELVDSRGPRFDGVLGKLTPLNAGSRQVVEKALDDPKPQNGFNALEAILSALDSGGKEPQSWSSGPEEVIVLACGLPWLSPVTDQQIVGATIGLKARLRLVAVHTVGVGGHGAEMLKTMADASGGRYQSLQK